MKRDGRFPESLERKASLSSFQKGVCLYLKVSDRIGELRSKNGMTQSSLASHMGITRSSVNAWEMGISLPSTEKLVELSNIFHTSVDYILGISSDECINLNSYELNEKELVYRLLNYFDESRGRLY